MKRIEIKIYNLILIVIIFLSIIFLCSFSIVNINNKLELKKFVQEMEIIQEKVNSIRKEYIIWENYNVNEPANFSMYIQSLGYYNANTSMNLYSKEFNRIINELNSETTEYWNMNIDSILSNYCYFNPESLKKYFGINDSKLNLIINFYTGNIIAKDGVKVGKNHYIYRQYDTEIGNKLTPISLYSDLKTVAEVIENNGLSQRIKVSFNESNVQPKILDVYYYYDESETKEKCNNFQDYIYERDENSIYFTINRSGKYYFFIKDTNYIEYTGIELEVNLCNKPILLDSMTGIYWDEEGNEIPVENPNTPLWYNYSSKELRFANAKTPDGNYWVWIPRFLYNITDGVTNIEYAYENTNKSTRNKIITGYKLQEAFEENEYGVWVSKFQVNIEHENKISVKPGKTLTVLSKENAINSINNFLDETMKNQVSLISIDIKNALLLIANSQNILISNDLIHYAGGGVDGKDYILNTKYSSTGNVYGVYDLITSENELTMESPNSDFGRFRLVIKK